MKVAGRRPGGSREVTAGGGDGEGRRSLVFAASRLSRVCSAPSRLALGLQRVGAARDEPLWALLSRRGGSSTSFCPKTERASAALPGSACSALPAFPLAAGGKLRSGFPPWVYPAQPGFGRNPREGFWQRRELRALARAGRSVCREQDGLPAGSGIWGALGWHGHGRAASGTFGTVGCVPVPVGVTGHLDVPCRPAGPTWKGGLG